jgi:hypothetical protein
MPGLPSVYLQSTYVLLTGRNREKYICSTFPEMKVIKYFYLFIFMVLRREARVLHMLAKYSTTEVIKVPLKVGCGSTSL